MLLMYVPSTESFLLWRAYRGLTIYGVVAFAIATTALAVPGRTLFADAWRGLRHGSSGMSLLVATSVCAAYLYGVVSLLLSFLFYHSPVPQHAMSEGVMFFETATTLILVVAIAWWIEAKLRASVAAVVPMLDTIANASAVRLSTAADASSSSSGSSSSSSSNSSSLVQESTVKSTDLRVGDIIRVHRSARFPADVVITAIGAPAAAAATAAATATATAPAPAGALSAPFSLPSSSSSSSVSRPVSVALVDLSALTGTLDSCEVEIGGRVECGAINVGQDVECRVVALSGTSRLSAMARFIAAVQSRKSAWLHTIQRFAALFTPLVVTLSAFTLLTWGALAAAGRLPEAWLHGSIPLVFIVNRALAVLVISCPCGLALAAPSAVLVTISACARYGLLIKGSAALDALTRVTTFVFDVNGTLTDGAYAVRMQRLDERMSERDILRIVALAEAHVEHAVARALLAFAQNELQQQQQQQQLPASAKAAEVVSPLSAAARTVVDGLGVALVLSDGRRVCIGSARFVSAQLDSAAAGGDAAANASVSAHVSASASAQRFLQAFESALSGTVFLVIDGAPTAVFRLQQRLRRESAAVVRQLQAQGYAVHACSGAQDALESVASGMSALGLPAAHVHSGQMPLDKVATVKALQKQQQKRGSSGGGGGSGGGGAVVCFVGDGINDSAVLVQADVSVSLRSGAAIAQSAADVVLHSSLGDLLTMLDVARAVRRRVEVIVALALLYNALAIPCAAGALVPVGFLVSPELAAFAMLASSVVVLGCAATLRFYKPPTILPRQPGQQQRSRDKTVAADDESATDAVDAGTLLHRDGKRSSAQQQQQHDVCCPCLDCRFTSVTLQTSST
jgi:cation transport ATPase